MIQFKQREDEQKWAFFDFRLKFLVELFDLWGRARTTPCVLVTDLDTPGVHLEHGPHYRKQAADLSIRSLGLAQAEEFAKWVNALFDYGRGFKVAIVGSIDPSGSHDDHLHIQIPPPYKAMGKVRLFEDD